ncbi:hypothetical protein EDB92DRAFT_347878 [Lactarius akahatsu]|uniref:Uncharacterized protein n=1 Tax=Lactarius akahatsu TaxID=416441 RepID=A0AAD4QEQ2_9AGAM|nr:hypothetical protein EDB92DRAFT_347878 [Lactarius akahatsu]
MMCYRILVASYTDGLTSLLFDPKGPTLEVTSKIKSDGIIIALKFNEDGNATVVGHIPSGAQTPHLYSQPRILLLSETCAGTADILAREMLIGCVILCLASTRPEPSWLLRCPPRLHTSRSTPSLRCCSSRARVLTRSAKRARTRTTSCPSPDAPNS